MVRAGQEAVIGAGLSQGGDGGVNGVERRSRKLACLPRVADLVGLLPVEANRLAGGMKSRLHPVPGFRRRRDMNGSGDRDVADPRKGIGDDLRLQHDLTRIGDMGVDTSSAERIRAGIPAVRRWLVDLNGGRERQALLHAIDAHGGALARNRPGNQEDLAVVPRDHAAASRRLLDGCLDQIPRCQHVIRRSGQAARMLLAADVRRLPRVRAPMPAAASAM